MHFCLLDCVLYVHNLLVSFLKAVGRVKGESGSNKQMSAEQFKTELMLF